MYARTLVLSFLFVLSLTSGTLAGGKHAYSPIETCTAKELGITEMEKNQTGLIGCFRDTSSPTGYMWKAPMGASSAKRSCYTTAVYMNVAHLYQTGQTSYSLQDVDQTGTMPSDILTVQGTAIPGQPDASGMGNDIPGQYYAAGYCKTGYVRVSCGAVAAVKGGCVADASLGSFDTPVKGIMTVTCCKT